MSRTARLLILVLLASFALGSRVCTSIRITHRGYATHRNVSHLHAQLTDSVAGCQFVFDDVVIENFGVNRFSEEPLDDAIRSLQTDFLDSIVEISGQLVIKRVNLKQITLRSLRTIRGYNSVEVTQSKYPTRLELPRLSAIVHGDVCIIGNLHASLHCYLSRSIDWTNLFQSHTELQQQFIDRTVVVTHGNRMINASDLNEVDAVCSSLINCHDSCPTQTSGKKMCWSDGPNGCQSFHGCLSGKKLCNSCYRNPVTGSEECCDSNCLGGCSGRPEACSGCRGVQINGVCRQSCSRFETGVLGMKQMGNICVRKCDMPFLTSSEENHCLRQCPPNEIPVNGVCKRCAVSCKECTLQSRMLSDKMSMTLKKNGCVIWEAIMSLDVSAQHLRNKASLESLELLQVFYGRLTIRRTHRLGVDNLRFLRNLRYVSGVVGIMLLETQYIGLVSLEYTQHLLLRDISGLCKAWYPSKRIREIQEVTKEFPIHITNLKFDETSEVCRNAACDTRCRDECWGPGPDMCVV